MAAKNRVALELWLGLLALASLFAASHPLRSEPIPLHSEASHFALRITGMERPERVNHIHSLELLLTTANGEPVPGAAIVLTGQRRYSSTPLPTLPQVSAGPDAGHYRVRGLRFHMPGDWRLTFGVTSEKIRDRVTLDLVVK